MNGSVAVTLLAAPLAARWRGPDHVGIEPDRQGATLLQRRVIISPVYDRAARRRRFAAHARPLSCSFREMNPIGLFAQQSPSSGDPYQRLSAMRSRGELFLCSYKNNPKASAVVRLFVLLGE